MVRMNAAALSAIAKEINALERFSAVDKAHREALKHAGIILCALGEAKDILVLGSVGDAYMSLAERYEARIYETSVDLICHLNTGGEMHVLSLDRNGMDLHAR